MKYELIYFEQPKLVWTLILIPLFLSGVFIAGMSTLYSLPDWTILIASGLLIAASLAFVLFAIRRWIKVKCQVTISEQLFSIRLLQKSHVYAYQEIEISWDKLANFDGGNYDATVTIVDPTAKFTLTLFNYEPRNVASFRDFVAKTNEKIAAYNEGQTQSNRIATKSIFESVGARIGAICFVLLLLALTTVYVVNGSYFSSLNGWKITYLWFTSTPYIALVYIHWRTAEPPQV